MPLFLLICLLSAFNAGAQPVVILDKEWKEPLTITDSTDTRIHPQFFPLYLDDVDAVIELTSWYIKILEENRSNLNLNEIKGAGASKFIAVSSYDGKDVKFQLNLVTRKGQSGYSMQLVNNNDGHKKRLQKLRAFLDYLRNNRFLVLPE